jgi:uncharacterized protein (DUF433 family)
VAAESREGSLEEMTSCSDDETRLLERITVDSAIFGGKPIIRGRRLSVEHVLAMLAAGDDADTLLAGYPWLVREDILACLAYARRVVARDVHAVRPTACPSLGFDLGSSDGSDISADKDRLIGDAVAAEQRRDPR